MKGFQFNDNAASGILLAALCFAGLGSVVVDAQYSMQATCMYVPNNTYIGNPNNCAGWGLCRNGNLVYNGTCGSGFLYNMRSGICDYPSNVQCQTTVQEICSTLTSPQFVGDPNDCNQYCYCSNSTGIECTNCPDGQYFTASPPSCIWATANGCAASSVCRLVKDNTFVQNPAQCGEFLSCYGGVARGPPGTCSNEGYTYNTLTGTCDPTNTCTGQTSPSGTNGPFPQNTAACKDIESGSYVSDGKTCGGFYACTADTTTGTWGKCPMGTQFNPAATFTTEQGATVTGVCVTPYTFNCEYNRCMNLDQSYVAEYGCKTFTYCQNQLPVKEGLLCSDVNPNTLYFNEATGECVVEKPQQAICGPA